MSDYDDDENYYSDPDDNYMDANPQEYALFAKRLEREESIAPQPARRQTRSRGRKQKDEGQEREQEKENGAEGEGQGQGQGQGENEVSEYNDGKGIHYIINLHPQLPPPAPNEKRRVNARAPTVNSNFYAHEASCFAEILDEAIKAVDRDETTLNFKIVKNELRTDRFTLTYTIARTSFKDMQLKNETAFKALLDAAKEKAKPEAKLDMYESPLAPSASNTTNDEGTDKVSRKRKVPPEEEELAEFVTQIQGNNRCSDKSCSSRFCFVGNPTASHVRLTPILLNIWASAMLADMPGVDENNPPKEEKDFWQRPQQIGDMDDIESLARRRVAANKAQTSPNITINNDYSFLATLLQPLIGNQRTTTATKGPSTPSHSRAHGAGFASPAKPARMTMIEFCNAFDLSDEIQRRLAFLKLAGPHLLAYVENSLLDKHLEIGQRAEVRHAEAEWQKAKTSLF
ncbi:hypothetical protein FB45DRAFT_1029776 [Roridomyces roridus]|uniref:Uncharacterized protein n=1 Tax=Roridomyces roridus TaxID=1738132 RepID=A0AAD7BQG8_9AGAR|nr:hypothetical protein FB45DRAFT_1029776 [Roridomyces roridus]